MKNPLQGLMLRYGLSRRDVAGLLNKPLNSAKSYSNSTVDNWLSGKTAVPSVALGLNIPGNTLVGGGGGIALLAGMSGLFTSFYFAVAVAVAPIPLLVLLTGYQPLG